MCTFLARDSRLSTLYAMDETAPPLFGLNLVPKCPAAEKNWPIEMVTGHFGHKTL